MVVFGGMPKWPAGYMEVDEHFSVMTATEYVRHLKANPGSEEFVLMVGKHESLWLVPGTLDPS